MQNITARKVIRILLLGFGVSFLLLCAGGIFAVLNMTVINPWIFFGSILILAVASGALLHPLWRKLSGRDNIYLNMALHTVVFTIILASVLLMTNYYCADFDHMPRETVIIDKKIKKTRYRTRRVSRRVYTRGAPYNVYFVNVIFADGLTRELEIPKRLYDDTHKGDTATILTGRGRLSFKVVDPSSLKVTTKHKSNKNKRSRRPTTRRIYSHREN
ncbi:MAG: hypothetical protein K2L97_06585 [Muribaculaceae bacterium]|nr:hypothetical protein [Muribaculaceae bacterium]